MSNRIKNLKFEQELKERITALVFFRWQAFRFHHYDEDYTRLTARMIAALISSTPEPEELVERCGELAVEAAQEHYDHMFGAGHENLQEMISQELKAIQRFINLIK